MPPRRRQRGRKKRICERHAASRLVKRTDGKLSFEELKRRVADGKFEYVSRQSVTRTLCRVRLEDESHVYFILNRKKKSIVTVLEEDWGDMRAEDAP